MRISLFAPVISPINDAGYLRALARGAEERGFHGIWLGEHVVLFAQYEPRIPIRTMAVFQSALKTACWSRSRH